LAFVIIAAWNFLSFLPQYFLLVAVYYDYPVLHQKAEPEASGNGFMETFCNPFYSLYRGWNLFVQQPIVLLSLSFTMLWLTILSPHDPVFTAYLMFAGYQDYQLGIFRAVGAVMGVIAAFIFPYLARAIGLQKSMLLFIFEEGIAVACAGVALWLYTHDYYSYYTRWLFLVFVVLSRPGLYGFEVGEIQAMQQGVPEKHRGSVNSVESSMTALTSLVFFIPPVFVTNPQDFIYLIWASIGCINLGSFIFAMWCTRWEMSSEEHRHGGTEHDKHNTLHTAAQSAQLDRQADIHTHLHFTRTPCC
jgi:iron-regulated transporter 1